MFACELPTLFYWCLMLFIAWGIGVTIITVWCVAKSALKRIRTRKEKSRGTA